MPVKTPKHTPFFSESSRDLFTYSASCTDVNGTWSSKDKMISERSFHSYFHHLKRSALPKGPWSLIPPHLKWETAGTGVAAPQNKVPVCAALLTHMSWEVLGKARTERTFWVFKVQLPCLFDFSEFLKKHLEGVSFLSCLVNILHSSSGHVF